MNNAIANILKNQLVDLPMIQKLAGLVQVAEYQESTFGEDGESPRTVIKRIPISDDIAFDPSCIDQTLVPDDTKTGLLYFEDRGSDPLGYDGKYQSWRSNLRLVCWLNTKTLTTPVITLTPSLINTITARFNKLANTHVGMFLQLRIEVGSIPVKSAAIFSAYTYNLYDTQYIMPPFEFFAMDVTVVYKMVVDCNPQILLGGSNEC